MSITVTEDMKSRSSEDSKNASQTRVYSAKGSADVNEIITAVKAEASTTATVGARTLPRLKVIPQPVFVDIDAPLRSRWAVTVKYGRSQKEEPATGESTYSFDTSGGMQHITQAIATTAYDKDGATTSKTGKTIGLTKDGVAGVDIPVGQFAWSETHYLPNATVTESYKQTLADMVGSVNDDTFRGRAAGEVMCLAPTGTTRGTEDWAITFNFVVIKNETDEDIDVPAVDGQAAHEITYSKKGHEYLEVRYKTAQDTGKTLAMEVAKLALVHTVLKSADFDDLELPE